MKRVKVETKASAKRGGFNFKETTFYLRIYCQFAGLLEDILSTKGDKVGSVEGEKFLFFSFMLS